MIMTKDSSIATRLSEAFIKGAVEIESTPAGLLPRRLPQWARAQGADGQLLMAESQASGVRLVFRTAATIIELDTLPTKRAYVGLPPRPDGVYDLVIDGKLERQASVSGGKVLRIDPAQGSANLEPGESGTARFAGLPARDKIVEIWLPHDETTELVGLRTDAPVEVGIDRSRPVWLHHGSSISQGSNAATPTGIWPVVAALKANVDLVNLGFGGSALLDPFTARTMSDTPADLISVKLGINIVNADLMRLRAFGPAVHGFLDTIREGHKQTPLVVISPIYCPIHETVPGPCAFDMAALGEGRVAFVAQGRPEDVAQGKLTLSIIREQLKAIVAQRAASDPNIHYVDGLALYGAADNATMPLLDALHPDGQTHRMMGERFVDLVFSQGVFGAGRGQTGSSGG